MKTNTQKKPKKQANAEAKREALEALGKPSSAPAVAQEAPAREEAPVKRVRGTVAVQCARDVHRELKLLCAQYGLKMEQFATDAIYVAIDAYRQQQEG